MKTNRREFLARSAAVAIGAGMARTWPSAAFGAADVPGAAVPGPFSGVYRGIGVPRGLALSLSQDAASTRTVTWLTTGALDVGSRVQFGTVPLHATAQEIRSGAFLDREISGASAMAPYGFGEAGEPNSGQPLDGEQPVRVHRATMTGLREGETIGYRVGGGDQWSPVHRFAATPRRDQGVRFTHFGDHGTTTASRRMTAAVAEQSPDFHVIAGDISYANGDQRLWDVWANEFEPLSASVPVMCAPGNHEAKDFNGETYRSRFTFPNHGAAWYSLDYHNVHLVSTTAGAFLSGSDPQTARDLVVEELTWLERGLATAAARRAAGELDFLVVTQHFPLYTDHRTRGPFSPELVAAEEQILQRYQVDLVLVGHDHMYQRSKPMAYGVPTGAAGGDTPGYVQIAAGAGGKSLYEFTPIDTTELASDPENPWQRWSLWSDAHAREFSFVSYDVNGAELSGTAYGWLDVEGQNDIPQDTDRYDEELVRVNADAVDPALRAREIDRFVIRRKPAALLREVPRAPRPVADIVAGVPEAHGIVVANLAEDCTRHRH